jgi:hypothetical protein
MTKADAAKPKRVRRQKYPATPLAEMPDEASMGPAVKALSPQNRVFVYELAVGPSGYGALVRAVRVAKFCTPTSSNESVQAHAGRTLHRADVQEALKELGGKRMRIAAFVAMRSLESIAANPEHPHCVKAAQILLGHAFPVESTHHITVEKIDHTRQALDELRTLRRLGVAREKLIELYGADGLFHLEQQLDGSLKLIEGTVNGK